MDKTGPIHGSKLQEEIQPMGTMVTQDILANSMGSVATTK